jgi:predicted  nucleic acid-binding Zn-ribbon protein
MSQSFNLYQLQRIDSKRDQLIQRVDFIQHVIEDRTEINHLEKNLVDLEVNRDSLLEKIALVDQDIQGKKIKINQSESSLYGGKVQNPKELQALQAEIASLNKYVSENETKLTSMMQEFEMIEKQDDQARAALEEGISTREKQNVLYLNEKDSILKELEKLDSERQLAITQIYPQHILKYEEIRKKKKNIAVTNVEDDTCSACGVSLTPSEWQAARSPDQIVFCPSCSRIIYAG